MDTSEIATRLPQEGDVIEVVVRGRVKTVQVEGVNKPIVYFQHDGDGSFEYDGYAPPVYLNNHVQALTVITPAKPQLDLDALPTGTIIEALRAGETVGVYRKMESEFFDGEYGRRVWASLSGRRSTNDEVREGSDELVELVRKDTLA